MKADKAVHQLRSWIRSHHLLCRGQYFIFETIDQSQLDRFEDCLRLLGGHIEAIRTVGNWPMGPRRAFKILRAEATVPRSKGQELQRYWAENGSFQTRFSEISD